MVLRDDTTKPARPKWSSPWRKVITLWIPRQFLESAGVNLKRFITDVNEKIVRRGFILCDGQVLTTPISHVIEERILEPDYVLTEGQLIARPMITVGEHMWITYEPGAENATFDVPLKRDRQAPQREFFGLENPYQMAEDGTDYTWSQVSTIVTEPYLSPDEWIVEIIHGEKERVSRFQLKVAAAG